MQKYNKMQQEIADDLTYQITDDIKHSTRHYKLSDFGGEFKFTEYVRNHCIYVATCYDTV